MTHTTIISKAMKARKAIADKVLDISELQSDLACAEEILTDLKADLAEIETEAADAGLSVAELHDAVDAAKEKQEAEPKKKAGKS